MNNSDNKLKIFISYAKEDIIEVRELAYKLQFDGYDTWIDEHKLLPGQDWRLEIESSIEKSDIILLCLSNTSINKRGYIQKEMRLAIDTAELMPEGSIFIIPVRLEECEVPRKLQSLQWVDLFLSDGFEKLKKSLEKVALKMDIIITPLIIDKDDLSGIYFASGNNEDGENYDGQVIIHKEKDSSYKIIWNIGGDKWESTGNKKGKLLEVKGDFNFVYEIRDDKTLYGEWEPGLFEKLRPMPKGF